MDFSIASILALDGLSNGAISALLALALAAVLVFAVTRIIFIPQGEFVAFGALTLALLQQGKVPGTVWFLLILAGACAVGDVVHGLRSSQGAARIGRQLLGTLAWPLPVSALTLWAAPQNFSLGVQALLTLALVTLFGALLYRLACQSLADASVLVLLTVSVGVHFALTGLGLLFFGAEGFRNPSFWDTRSAVGPVMLSGQTLIIFGASIALIVALWLFFERSLWGKALRATAVNRLGARLMGISSDGAGRLSFTLAAFLGALSGLLIGPTTTLFDDSGLLIGLKDFLAAVFAGLASYPQALLGALAVGLLESFGSFWASAFKEVIVFGAILPVLLPKLIGTSGNFETIVFGLVLVAVLKYAPDGLWPLLTRWLPARQRVRDWQGAARLPARDKPARGELLLEVHKLREQFGGLVAVNDVSFAIRSGDIVGLIGPNGAGKSTTFNLVTGVLALSSGAVRFRGQAVGGLSSRRIAQAGMSRTFQHVLMVPEMTVLDNVALGVCLRSKSGPLRAMLRLDRAEERCLFAEAEAQLARIGMAHQMQTLAGNLALGPQRLMEIARALCTDPAHVSLEDRVMLGLALVPEKRELFGSMPVEDNLVLGGFRAMRLKVPHWRSGLDRVYALFPRLKERRSQLAGTLSGGERQMLALGRALMSAPKLLMLDEPSLGLAPLVVREIFRTIAQLRAQGTSILLIEQNARAALEVADHCHVLETGAIVLHGPAARLRDDPRVIDTYLGAARPVA